MPQPIALFENLKAPPNVPANHLFTDLIDTCICMQPDQLLDCLGTVEAYSKQDYYCVGYLAYEAGYVFQPTCQELLPTDFTAPLCQFHIFKHHEQLSAQDLLRHPDLAEVDHTPSQGHLIAEQHFNLTEADYTQKVQRIFDALRAGDSYQANFTGKLSFNYRDSPLALYGALRLAQPVEYAAYLPFEETTIISLSPELFFRKQGQHICVKPMKGTAPRSDNPEQDREHRDFLAADAKNRAENVMIVDLLRNDLGRFAEPGTVQVQALCHIEAYKTVYQMVSEITAQIGTNVPLHEILSHLFPCGSITGAPKISTMHLIRSLEDSPRGVYTGAIGFLMPNQDMCFNVAIRTLCLDHHGRGEMGIGSGIVIDSDPSSEYQECLLKATFLNTTT